MKRFVIIDGNAILHRAFHALPPLTTKDGELVNAVFGFSSMLLRVVENLQPNYLVVTFDRPKPTFRKTLYAGYQANRPKMDEGLSSQIERVHEVVNTMNIPIYEVDGFEADDVIGTIAEKIKTIPSRKNVETVIVTGDRDILQLVDGVTKVCMPVKGLVETKTYGIKDVEEKFGIHPSQMVDYKALVGDASDNYPGVSGIGPKTAVSLIQAFGTLEEIYSHIGQIQSEKVRRLLTENAELAALSKKLATIVRDVPLSFDETSMTLPSLDTPQVKALFTTLDFKSLITRLSFISSHSDSEEAKQYLDEVLPQKKIKTEDKKQLSMF